MFRPFAYTYSFFFFHVVLWKKMNAVHVFLFFSISLEVKHTYLSNCDPSTFNISLFSKVIPGWGKSFTMSAPENKKITFIKNIKIEDNWTSVNLTSLRWHLLWESLRIRNWKKELWTIKLFSLQIKFLSKFLTMVQRTSQTAFLFQQRPERFHGWTR